MMNFLLIYLIMAATGAFGLPVDTIENTGPGMNAGLLNTDSLTIKYEYFRVGGSNLELGFSSPSLRQAFYCRQRLAP